MLEKLAESNVLCRAYSNRILGGKKNDYRSFRRHLVHFITERPPENPQEEAVFQKIREINQNDLNIILWVEHNKDAINHQLINLIRKIARKIADNFECDNDDVRNQAKLFMQWAIYGYNTTSFKLTTYVGKVVKQELRRYALMQYTGLSSSSDDLARLKRLYFSADAYLRSQGVTATYHSICEYLVERLELSGKKAIKLSHKMIGVMASFVDPPIENQHATANNKDFDWGLKAGLDSFEKHEEIREAQETCDFIYIHILSNEIERTLFNGLRKGKSVTQMALELGLSSTQARAIFLKIRHKTKSFWARDVA